MLFRPLGYPHEPFTIDLSAHQFDVHNNPENFRGTLKGSIRPQTASHDPIDEQGKKADRGVTVDPIRQTVVNRLDKQVTFHGAEKVRHRALTDLTGLLVTVAFNNSQIARGPDWTLRTNMQ